MSCMAIITGLLIVVFGVLLPTFTTICKLCLLFKFEITFNTILKSTIMKKNISIIAISLCSLFAVSGCATIVHGTNQDVIVRTVPEKASVQLDGQVQNSPAIFSVKGSSGYNAIVTKNGYKTGHAHVKGSFRAGSAIFGNILWLVPGVLIDLITGAAYEMQKEANVSLEKN
jgi:hypothetical protein